MSSITDICNRALSEIGTQSTIASLEENSAEAEQCSLWYDKLRKQLLRSAPWGFARYQTPLTQLGDLWDATAPYPSLFKYAYPPLALKIRYLLRQPPPLPPATQVPVVGDPVVGNWLRPSRTNRYLIGLDIDLLGNQTKIITSNVCNAIGVFTADVTNPEIFDELFEGALTAALSYKLVIPLSGNVGMKNDFKAEAMDAVMSARAVDGNEAIPVSEPVTDWIAARGRGGYYNAGLGAGAGDAFGGWGNWSDGNDNMSWGE